MEYQDNLIERLTIYIYNYIKKKGVIVNTYRFYDALNVPVIDYPLLSVYRLADTFMLNATPADSIIRISYSLNYPQLDALPGALKFASDSINEALMSYFSDGVCFVKIKDKVRSEYRIMRNDVNNSIYPFLNVTVSLRH